MFIFRFAFLVGLFSQLFVFVKVDFVVFRHLPSCLEVGFDIEVNKFLEFLAEVRFSVDNLLRPYKVIGMEVAITIEVH